MTKASTPKFKISGEFIDAIYGSLEIHLSKNGKKVRVRDKDTLSITEWIPVKSGSFYYENELFEVAEFINLN